jgi:hypothetical protein
MMTMEDLDLTSMGMLTTTMAITTTIMVDMRKINIKEMDMTMMATKTTTEGMEVVGTPDYPSGIPDMHTIHDPMISVS